MKTQIKAKNYRLRSLEIYCSRRELRRLIEEIDPDGRASRFLPPIKRVVYNGIAPGYIWHEDTNHKSGRWGIVIY